MLCFFSHSPSTLRQVGTADRHVTVDIGAVLNVHPGEETLPVAFFSRKLLHRERCYSATELEGLGVVTPHAQRE